MAVTFSELAKEFNISKANLNKRCADEHLKSISHFLDWRATAPHLGLSPTEIQDIEDEDRKSEVRRLKTLQRWNSKCCFKATYRKLIEVFLDMGRADHAEKLCIILRSSTSGEQEASCDADVATQLSLPSATPRSSLPGDSPVVPRRAGTLEEEIDALEKLFLDLVNTTADSFTAANLSLPHLKRCLTQLPVSTKVRHIKFLAGNLKNILKAENIEEIFAILGLYWDFMNCGLLVEMIHRFEKDLPRVKDELEKYLFKLKQFRCDTKVKEFINKWIYTLPPYFRNLTLELDEVWMDRTLEELEKFIKEICRKHAFEPYSVLLKMAESGSVTLTGAVQSSFPTRKLSAQISRSFLHQHGVLRMTFKMTCVYSSHHNLILLQSLVRMWLARKAYKARLQAHKKRLNIAQDLLNTEKIYVGHLKLIAVDFYKAVEDFNARSKHVMPHSDVQLMFVNIREIYPLNEKILQELQTCMDNWSRQEGLGDVFYRLAPILKLMYSTYIAGFEDAMKLLTEWTAKEKRFDTLVRDFAWDSSSGLGVSHYMLEPTQRLPRYKLLLTEYFKYLPEDSPDRPATAKALAIFSEVSDRINDRIKELENSNTILQIQRSLQDYEGSLLAPSRIFIKKGMLQKVSRKTPTQRMFFLFSDMLLHTHPSGTDIYKFRNKMPIYGMQVEEPAVSEEEFCFNVRSTTRSLILVARSEEEKQEWMKALIGAIDDDLEKRSSLRRGSMLSVQPEFGAKAPIMVPDKSVTMCQVCTAHFTVTFRKHHCRACGKVVCGDCSQWKAFLAYTNRTERVCRDCYLTWKQDTCEETDTPPTSPKKSESGVLNRKAYDEDDTAIAGYVLSQEGKWWTKLWYQITKDFVLYKFRAHEDIKAIDSLPLPGYNVALNRDSSVISLIHPSSKKQLCDSFKVEDPTDFENWISVLEKAVRPRLETSV